MFWFALSADEHCIGAGRMETAAWRRVKRARYLSWKHSLPGVTIHEMVKSGCKKRLCIRVSRVLIKFYAIGTLHYFSTYITVTLELIGNITARSWAISI
jgi:hypothetical protein